MSNFKVIDQVDVMAAAQELRETNLWDWLNIRKIFPGSQHVGFSDIVIRGPPVAGPITFNSTMANLESVTYFPAWYLPQTWAHVMYMQNQLGRVMVTRLDPQAAIGLHRDEGAYADAHIRYHIVIEGESLFECGGETLLMKAGMFFSFNHQLPHRVWNPTDDRRTTLIFDLRRTDIKAYVR